MQKGNLDRTKKKKKDSIHDSDLIILRTRSLNYVTDHQHRFKSIKNLVTTNHASRRIMWHSHSQRKCFQNKEILTKCWWYMPIGSLQKTAPCIRKKFVQNEVLLINWMTKSSKHDSHVRAVSESEKGEPIQKNVCQLKNFAVFSSVH